MDPKSSEQQKAQSLPFFRIDRPDVLVDIVNPASDELPDAVVMMNPIDSVQSKITKEVLGRIFLRHELSFEEYLPVRKIDYTIPRRDSLHATDLCAGLEQCPRSTNSSGTCCFI